MSQPRVIGRRRSSSLGLILGCVALVGACHAAELGQEQAWSAAAGDPCEDVELTGCEEEGDPLDYVRAMNAAYNCTYGLPLSGLPFMNYGCFCGPSNAGIDAEPKDAIDRACQQHDVNLWAICQNIPEEAGSTVGCNCYRHTPTPGCDGGTLTFPDDLNDCQQACANDLRQLLEESKQHPYDSQYQAYPNEQCDKGDDPPPSEYGDYCIPDEYKWPRDPPNES